MIAPKEEKIRARAKKLFAQQRYDKALKALLELHQLAPRDMSTVVMIGDTYTILKDRENAFTYLTKAAGHYWQAGYFSKAVVLYKKMNRIDPNSVPVREKLIELYSLQLHQADDNATRQKFMTEIINELLELAQLHKHKDQDLKSMACFKRILKLDPLHLQAGLALSRILVHHGRLKDGLRMLVNTAKKMISRRMISEALVLLKEAGKHEPENMELKLVTSQAHIADGDFESGFLILNDMLHDHPNHLGALKVLGQAHLSRNQLVPARDCFLRAFKLNQTETVGLEKAAVQLLKQGRVKDAYLGVEHLITFYVKKGKINYACRILEAVLQVDPHFLAANKRLYKIHEAMNNKEPMFELLVRVIQTYRDENNIPKQIEYIKKLLEVDPDQDVWRERLTSLIVETDLNEPGINVSGESSVRIHLEDFDFWDPTLNVKENLRRIGEQEAMDLDESGFFEDPTDQAPQKDEGVPELAMSEEEQIEALSAIPGREILLDRLDQGLKINKRRKTRLGLLFLDLDLTKWFTHSHGRYTAEVAVLAAWRKIMSCVRESDSVTRLSGTEFAVILHELQAPSGAETVAGKLLQALGEPIFPDYPSESFAATQIGITLFPDDGDNTDALINNAEMAVQRAADLGPDQFTFYTPKMNEYSFRRRGLERDMFRAMDQTEFELHYQPIVKLISVKQIVGVEVLLRWQHPELGLLYPDEFIWLAEELELIQLVGEWVLRKVVFEAEQWYKRGLPVPWMSVNTAAAQLQNKNFEIELKRILEDHDLPPGVLRLGLEGNEAMMLDPTGRHLDLLQRIRKMGVSLAVDDFGTGPTSLVTLKRSPVREVKIDKSFVHQVNTDEEIGSLVRAIIKISHEFGKKVVAEGIETAEQLQFMRDAGCDYGQGYFFCKPMPGVKLEEILQSRKPVDVRGDRAHQPQ